VSLEDLAKAESHIAHASSLLIKTLPCLEEEHRRFIIDAIEKLDAAQQLIRVIKSQLTSKFRVSYRV